MRIGKKKYRVREFSPLWHIGFASGIALVAVTVYLWAVLFTAVLG